MWAPPRPTFAVVTDLPDQDEYEVRVFDTRRHRRLVAAVEIVSPANKDRPENRRAFVTKCAALLQQRVSVAIVDLVTTRQFNLYGDLLELIGQADPALAPEPPPLYAAACRWTRRDEAWHFETWTHPLALGQPLPTLPLWLADDFAVPLELEASYEETCRILRLGSSVRLAVAGQTVKGTCNAGLIQVTRRQIPHNRQQARGTNSLNRQRSFALPPRGARSDRRR